MPHRRLKGSQQHMKTGHSPPERRQQEALNQCRGNAVTQSNLSGSAMTLYHTHVMGHTGCWRDVVYCSCSAFFARMRPER